MSEKKAKFSADFYELYSNSSKRELAAQEINAAINDVLLAAGPRPICG